MRSGQEDGRLELLDFGQCKALTADRQAALARLVLAMDRGWPTGVAQAMQAGSCKKIFVPYSQKVLCIDGTVVCDALISAVVREMSRALMRCEQVQAML